MFSRKIGELSAEYHDYQITENDDTLWPTADLIKKRTG